MINAFMAHIHAAIEASFREDAAAAVPGPTVQQPALATPPDADADAKEAGDDADDANDGSEKADAGGSAAFSAQQPGAAPSPALSSTAAPLLQSRAQVTTAVQYRCDLPRLLRRLDVRHGGGGSSSSSSSGGGSGSESGVFGGVAMGDEAPVPVQALAASDSTNPLDGLLAAVKAVETAAASAPARSCLAVAVVSSANHMAHNLYPAALRQLLTAHAASVVAGGAGLGGGGGGERAQPLVLLGAGALVLRASMNRRVQDRHAVILRVRPASLRVGLAPLLSC